MSFFKPTNESRRLFCAQSGKGIGNFLGTAYKTIAPHIKTVGEKIISSPVVEDVMLTAKKSVLDAGLQIAADTLKGKNKNLGQKLGRAKKQIAETIEGSISTNKSQKRKKGSRAASSKRKRGNKGRFSDIFDEDFY